jgi:hypothetical protein
MAMHKMHNVHTPKIDSSDCATTLYGENKRRMKIPRYASIASIAWGTRNLAVRKYKGLL